MAQESTLFQQVTVNHAILLIDASSSTTNPFGATTTIFDRISEVISTLPHETFNLLFWNSDNISAFFNYGIKVINESCTKAQVALWFKLVQKNITNGCCTMPHLGFAAIPPSWLTNTKTIYFITDGEISTHIQRTVENLSAEIKRMSSYNLHIITVENNSNDMRIAENLESAAGSDVYQCIRKQALTDCVCSFVSYNKSGKYIQIQKNKPPAGQIPYGDQFFAEQRTGDFINWFEQMITVANSDEQLAAIQKLAITIHYLSKDKPIRLVKEFILMFSRLFSDEMRDIAKQMLTDAVENEQAGKAKVFAEFRSQLRDLYALAANTLKQNVSDAINIGDQFITNIVNDHVLIGPSRLATGSITLDRYKYLQASYKTLAVFPHGVVSRELHAQCLRQWARLVYGDKYKCNVKEDVIIYLIMAELARVNVSNCPPATKSYRNLAITMLNKKRLNSNETEYERLLRGEFPTPNSGVVEDFNKMMEFVSRRFQLSATPMQMWKLLCVALPELYIAQTKHFEREQLVIIEPVTIDQMPLGTGYDYSCIITLTDISTTGGFSIKPHTYGISQKPCTITYTLSAEGKDQLLASGRCVCPICYTTLTTSDFVPLPPYADFVLPDAYQVASVVASVTEQKVQQPTPQPTPQPTLQPTPQTNIGTVVVLKGTVGCGKSTYSTYAKRAVEARNGKCLIVNTDVYARTGMDFVTQIIPLISSKLLEFQADECKDKVVIVDTCGDREQNKFVFNVNFSNWKFVTVYVNLDRSDPAGYLAWSLRNVLLRGNFTANDMFWLTAATSSVAKCKDIHRKKTNPLGIGKYWKFSNVNHARELDQLANAYEARLKPAVYEF